MSEGEGFADNARNGGKETIISTSLRLGAIVLFVESLPRAKAFYCDTLGLPLRVEDEHFLEVEMENVSLALLERDVARELYTASVVPHARPAGTTFSLTLFVDDVDELFAQLLMVGVPFLSPPEDQPWGQRTASFEDPDGNLFELSSPVAGAPRSPLT